MLIDMIRGFCEENSDKYYVYENYSGKYMSGEKCTGIVVKQEYSCMQMLFELTRYLECHDFYDADFELEHLMIDDLGLDAICYFPNMKPEQR